MSMAMFCHPLHGVVCRPWNNSKPLRYELELTESNNFVPRGPVIWEGRQDEKRFTTNLKLHKNNNEYLLKCFTEAFRIIKSNFTHKFLNGPINKKKFLNKKYLGITEFIGSKFSNNNTGMLIYNRQLSVCPLTTHLPIKLIPKEISKKLIQDKLELIHNFYLRNLGFKPKVAVTGLNPHCESTLKFNEDEKIGKVGLEFPNPSIEIIEFYNSDRPGVW